MRDDSIRSGGPVVGEAPKKGGVVGGKPPGSANASNEKKKRGAGKKISDTPAVNGFSPNASVNTAASVEETPPAFIPTEASHVHLGLEKKLKNLQKKMKQINEIKAKQERGEQLELTQIQKMKGEKELQDELDSVVEQMSKHQLFFK